MWIGSSDPNTRLTWMCNNEPDLQAMTAFKMLSSAFSSLGSLVTFLFWKQFLGTCFLSPVLNTAEMVVLGQKRLCHLFHVETGQVCHVPGFLKMQYKITGSNKWGGKKKKKLPIASSLRKGRQIYVRRINETSREKRVGANSENGHGNQPWGLIAWNGELFQPRFWFSLFTVFLSHNNLEWP